MKAFHATRYGGPDVMQYGDVSDPAPGKGDVLLEVHASSLNPVDWKVRSGIGRPLTGFRFPKVYGNDVAGEVIEVGPGVTKWKIGDRLYGSAGIFTGRWGGHAERAAVRANLLHRIPDTMSFEEAAVLPVAALTATQGIRLMGPVAGKQVLVNGATGGVGHYAVQVAVALGARVTAVCSARNADLARDLGAQLAIDYRSHDLLSLGQKWDAIFDTAVTIGARNARRIVTPGGFYGTPLPMPGAYAWLAINMLSGGPRVAIVNMRGHDEDYAELETLIAERRVRSVVEESFPLDRAAEAWALSEKGGARGKILVRVR